MKNLFSKKIAFVALGAMVVISACDKSPYPGYDMGENGVYYKFYKQDENGVKAVEGDLVSVLMTYKNNKDSVLFDSKKMSQTGTPFVEFPLNKSLFKGSFEDALMMMAAGDSASFMISADSIYLKTFRAPELPPYIEKGSMLTFEVKLEKITPKDVAQKEQEKKMEEYKAMMELRKNEEPKILAKYLQDNKITAKPTASGLYFIEKVKGKGANPSKGETVKVNYTGRLIDGTIFDTSDEATAKEAGLFDERRPYAPIEFPLGQGQVIPGWDEGIALMKVGSKAQLIIPSSIAYGQQGGGPIPPFSSLIFDVELVSVAAAK